MKSAERTRTRKGSTPPKVRRWLRESRLPLAISGLALLVYSRSLFCGFVRDDVPQIARNPQVQSWEYLPRLLGSHLWSQLGPATTQLFYRPLFSIWMLLVYTVGGLAPWFWHFSNILLHVAATYLVFRLCQRLTGSNGGAGVAATIFAVHPIHVDAVTWVSASDELLFTLFALGSILLLLGHNDGARPRVWASALLYGAGLFAKETGIAVLVILLVIAWLRQRSHFEGTSVMRAWKAGSPYLAATSFYLLARWSAMHQVGTEIAEHRWSEVVFTSPSIMLFYLKKLILPVRLSGSYTNAITASPTGGFWLEMSVLLVAAAVIIWLAVRYSPALGLAAALIVLPILPALAVVCIYPQGEMTNDRYLYLPSVGLSLAAALAAVMVQRLWSMRRPAQVALVTGMITVAVALSAATFAQQRFYQDDLAFYRRVIEINPLDGLSYSAIGDIYLDRGLTDLALEQLRKAHEVAPDNPKVTQFLARALFTARRYGEVESVLTQLLRDPNLQTARKNSTLVSLATVEISLQRLDFGQAILQQVAQSDPRTPLLHWTTGVLLQKEGLLEQAQAEYQKEFEITGDQAAKEQSEIIAKRISLRSAAPANTEVRN
jgi:protein O-mannosyl-transferase